MKPNATIKIRGKAILKNRLEGLFSID